MTDPTTAATEPLIADPAAPTAPPLAPEAGESAPAATEAATAPAAPTVETGRRRRLVILAGLGRIARFGVMLALFVGGLALGVARYQVSEPPSQPTAGSAVTSGVEAPASVKAMMQSLTLNDMDLLRASVAALRDGQGTIVSDPYRLLVGELQTIGMVEVTDVESLSTFVDGTRSATALIISGHGPQGIVISRHLIVQTVSGQIVTFK